MSKNKDLQREIIPEVVYAGSAFTGYIFTNGLRAYVRKNNFTRRITRGYFVKFLEMISGLSNDQAAELLRAEYIDGHISWEY